MDERRQMELGNSASSSQEPINEPSNIEKEVMKRLQIFVSYFVYFFEVQMSEYHDRLVTGQRKSGKTAEVMRKISNVVERGAKNTSDFCTRFSIISFAFIVSEGAESYGSRKNREKLKKMSRRLFELNNDPDLVRKILVQGAGLIFINMEVQFMNILGSSKNMDSWQYAVVKVAKEAVKKFIGYLREHPSEEMMNRNLIFNSVIAPKSSSFLELLSPISKKLGLFDNFVRLNGIRTTITDIFEKLGIKDTDGAYYAHKEGQFPDDEDAWFRLALEYGDSEWESVKPNEYIKLPKPPKKEHGYLSQLTQGEFEKNLSSFDINIHSPVGLKIKLDKIKEEISHFARTVGNALKKNHDEIIQSIGIVEQYLDTLLKTAERTEAKVDDVLRTGERIEAKVNDVLECGERTGAKMDDVIGTVTQTEAEMKDLREIAERTEAKVNQTVVGTNEILNLMSPGNEYWRGEKPVFRLKQPGSFTGREEELAKLYEYVFREATTSYLSRVTVITGLGGVGKSKLASKFAEKFKVNFFDAVWMDADSEGSLRNSFIQLAEDACGVSDVEKLSTEIIVRKVYDFFNCRKSQKKMLMIFDNADNTQMFHNFMPDFLFPSGANDHPADGGGSSENKCLILITSRETEWKVRYEEIEQLHLRVFRPEEAKEYVEKELKARKGKEESIMDLVNTLYYFPLALKIATGYIKEKWVTKKEYTICDYLNDYKNKQRELLDHKPFQDLEDDDAENSYKKTICTTWDITMDKIFRKRYGELAKTILNIISLSERENIWRGVFIMLSNVSENDVEIAVRLIVNYSMVDDISQDGDQSVLRVHALVQDVTRMKMEERGELGYFLDLTLELFTSDWEDVRAPRFSQLLMKNSYQQKQLRVLLSYLDSMPTNDNLIRSVKVLEKLEESNNSGQLEQLERISFLKRRIEILRKLRGDESAEVQELICRLETLCWTSVCCSPIWYSGSGLLSNLLSIYEERCDLLNQAEVHSLNAVWLVLEGAFKVTRDSVMAKTREDTMRLHIEKTLELLECVKNSEYTNTLDFALRINGILCNLLGNYGDSPHELISPEAADMIRGWFKLTLPILEQHCEDKSNKYYFALISSLYAVYKWVGDGLKCTNCIEQLFNFIINYDHEIDCGSDDVDSNGVGNFVDSSDLNPRFDIVLSVPRTHIGLCIMLELQRLRTKGVEYNYMGRVKIRIHDLFECKFTVQAASFTGFFQDALLFLKRGSDWPRLLADLYQYLAIYDLELEGTEFNKYVDEGLEFCRSNDIRESLIKFVQLSMDGLCRKAIMYRHQSSDLSGKAFDLALKGLETIDTCKLKDEIDIENLLLPLEISHCHVASLKSKSIDILLLKLLSIYEESSDLLGLAEIHSSICFTLRNQHDSMERRLHMAETLNLLSRMKSFEYVCDYDLALRINGILCKLICNHGTSPVELSSLEAADLDLIKWWCDRVLPKFEQHCENKTHRCYFAMIFGLASIYKWLGHEENCFKYTEELFNLIHGKYDYGYGEQFFSVTYDEFWPWPCCTSQVCVPRSHIALLLGFEGSYLSEDYYTTSWEYVLAVSLRPISASVFPDFFNTLRVSDDQLRMDVSFHLARVFREVGDFDKCEGFVEVALEGSKCNSYHTGCETLVFLGHKYLREAEGMKVSEEQNEAQKEALRTAKRFAEKGISMLENVEGNDENWLIRALETLAGIYKLSGDEEKWGDFNRRKLELEREITNNILATCLPALHLKP